MMFSDSRRQERDYGTGGFTLVEALLALVLAGLVVSGVVTVLRVHKMVYVRGAHRIEAGQKARYAIDYLERELRLAGSGTLPEQPVIVYADDDALLFNVDLVSRDPDDVVAVYHDADAAPRQTLGPDSASMSLPNGAAYPLVWYGPNRSPGWAETITYRFVQLADSQHAMLRRINNAPPDTLVKGLSRPDSGFFTYRAVNENGVYRRLPTPLAHDAAIHGGPADSARSARTDSIRNISAAFAVNIETGGGTQASLEVRTGVDLRNSGLILHASCGDRPIAPQPPELTATGTPGVRLTWDPAFDESGGEGDVRQYNLYRSEARDGPWTPIQAIPLAQVETYEYEDISVAEERSYWYAVAAADCTPAESDWATAGPLYVPAVEGEGANSEEDEG